MQQDNSLSVVFNSILVALLPHLCKWMTRIPQPVYFIMAVLSLLLSIIVLLVNRHKYKEETESFIQLIQRFKWSLYSCILSIAFFTCTFIYPTISVQESEQTYQFIARMNKIDSLKVLADNNNVDAMIDLGIAYSRGHESEMAFINYSEAEKYFEMAAEAHSAKAYALLAQLKYRGYGKKKSRRRALEDLYHGYQIDSCNSDIFKLLAEMNVREHELPEVVNSEEKWITGFLNDWLRLQQIMQQFCTLCEQPIDNSRIIAFSSSKLPEVELLAKNVFNAPYKFTVTVDDVSFRDIDETKELIALMCLYANDHTQGYEYVKSFLNRTDNAGQFSRLLFTEKQRYSELQERIDTVLIHTENVILDLLENSYSQPLSLDLYYLQALRLEQFKRNVKGNLKDDSAFQELYNNYLRLLDTFINTPAKVGPIPPLPSLMVQIKPNGLGFIIEPSLQ